MLLESCRGMKYEGVSFMLLESCRYEEVSSMMESCRGKKRGVFHVVGEL